MDVNEVIAIFLKLVGASEPETEQYRTICENAVRSLRARLRDNIDESESGDSLNTAAAALAFKRYVQMCSANGEYESFKVGEVSVTASQANRLSSAEEFLRDAMYDIRGILRDDEFLFGRIL